MNALIPILKVFSQIDIRNGSKEMALVDLTHLRMAFEQDNADSLDWDRMRKVFVDTRPGIVDARTLENRRRMGAFFRSEVARRLSSEGTGSGDAAAQIVIILSGPAFLEDQDPGGPVELPDNADRCLFYIRYQGVPAPPADDLERVAQQFKGRLYDAASTEQVREILASVLAEISRL
jgi:hypothetical protein